MGQGSRIALVPEESGVMLGRFKAIWLEGVQLLERFPGLGR